MAISEAVLVSSGCWNKWLQTHGVTTVQIYYSLRSPQSEMAFSGLRIKTKGSVPLVPSGMGKSIL